MPNESLLSWPLYVHGDHPEVLPHSEKWALRGCALYSCLRGIVDRGDEDAYNAARDLLAEIGPVIEGQVTA